MLERDENDGSVNVHNRMQLQYWRANCDLQVILDAHACIEYLTKYIGKPETKTKDRQRPLRAAFEDASRKKNVKSGFYKVPSAQKRERPE